MKETNEVKEGTNAKRSSDESEWNGRGARRQVGGKSERELEQCEGARETKMLWPAQSL